jgi:hypothetical protein
MIAERWDESTAAPWTSSYVAFCALMGCAEWGELPLWISAADSTNLTPAAVLKDLTTLARNAKAHGHQLYCWVCG